MFNGRDGDAELRRVRGVQVRRGRDDEKARKAARRFRAQGSSAGFRSKVDGEARCCTLGYWASTRRCSSRCCCACSGRSEGGAMEPRVSLITLGVADLDRAQRFYEALGSSGRRRAAARCAFFQAGRFGVGVVSAREPCRGRRRRAQPATAFAASRSRTMCATRMRSTRSWPRRQPRAAMVEAGARTRRTWGGRTGYFADPDGHLWEVAWNPHFALAEDGALTLPP